MQRKTISVFWKLNKDQVSRLSEFVSNLSLLVIASFVIPQLQGLDRIDPAMLGLGVITAIAALLFSLFLLRKRRK